MIFISAIFFGGIFFFRVLLGDEGNNPLNEEPGDKKVYVWTKLALVLVKWIAFKRNHDGSWNPLPHC